MTPIPECLTATDVYKRQTYQLTLSECAVIAGITQNPSKYNPISHPDKNAERREKVLNNMKEQGMISQAEYDEAMADDVYSRIATCLLYTSRRSISGHKRWKK